MQGRSGASPFVFVFVFVFPCLFVLRFAFSEYKKHGSEQGKTSQFSLLSITIIATRRYTRRYVMATLLLL